MEVKAAISRQLSAISYQLKARNKQLAADSSPQTLKEAPHKFAL
jgi:hypothetical protein